MPSSHADLLALPGVGAYTAAAVASFAFGARHAVVDTNVRRVFARIVAGTRYPAPALTAAETVLAERLLPVDDATAARWAVASMELGALVCTARTPRCETCPVGDTLPVAARRIARARRARRAGVRPTRAPTAGSAACCSPPCGPPRRR